MLPQARQLWKQALWWTRIKLIYTRITLTRYTTLYFFFALLNCVVLVILQGVAYADNFAAGRIIGGLLSQVNVTKGLPVLSHGVLQMCDSLPGQPGTTCTIVQLSKAVGSKSSLASRSATRQELWNRIVVGSDDDDDDEEVEDAGAGQNDGTRLGNGGLRGAVPGSGVSANGGPVISGQVNGSLANNSSTSTVSDIDTADVENTPTDAIQDTSCAQSMMWFQDVLGDEKREDVVTLLFNFWLFSLALVTILNESLPHLGASLTGHVLGTAWAAFRVSSSEQLRRNYVNLIVNGACRTNFIGELGWDLRRAHTIPILVVNAVALGTMAYLSLMLFKVYSSQSFGRVGASDQVNRIYKIVLVFSAFLQLTAFFSVASTAMWLDHICSGLIHDVVHHSKLYLAAFIASLLLLLPWLVLGWVSVRKEGRRRFLIFSVISVFLVGVSTMMFASALYRFIFTSWPFFTTITLTAYVTTVATALLGVWCRLNFGKGLAHFLQVSDALDGVDFTPVYFSKDAEKGNTFDVKLNRTYSVDEKYSSDLTMAYIQQPELSYNSASKAPRGQSVYSQKSGTPVKLSSTPSLFQERDRAATRVASTRRTKTFGGTHLNLGRDGYTQPQIPPRSAAPSIRTRVSHRSRDLTSSPQSSVGSTSPELSPAQTRAATPPAVPSRPGLPANPRIHPA